MKQKQYAPLSVGLMAASLYAVEKGYIDAVPVDKVLVWEEGLHQFLTTNQQDLLGKLNDGGWNDELESGLKAAMDAYVKQAAV